MSGDIMEKYQLDHVIDTIPFGMLICRGSDIRYMNLSLRSVLESKFDDLGSLIASFPELGVLADDIRDATPIWVTLNNTAYSVGRFPNGPDMTFVFIPAWYLSALDSDLSQLQEAHSDLVEIFENCFDGIYVADGAGKTLWMNPGFERAYGLSARNFLGRDAIYLEREGFLDPLITWKVITTKKRQTALQSTKSGRKVLATGIPLFAKDGSVRKVIINSRDTTELVDLQNQLSAAHQEIRRYEDEISKIRKDTTHDGAFVWSSDAMQNVVSLAVRAARFEVPVLIAGADGVGKKALADLIIRQSERPRQKVFQIGFGSFPDAVIEAELFGDAKAKEGGAGNKGLLERSYRGVLLLDRVDLMSPAMQERLASYLKYGHSKDHARRSETLRNLRVIAIATSDLETEVKEGRFRQDLYYRLSTVSIDVPPISKRQPDIMVLSQYFLDKFNSAYGLQKAFATGALKELASYHWPGNVREIRTLVERLCVTSPTELITDKDVTELLPTNRISQEMKLEPDRLLTAAEMKSQVRQYEAELMRMQVDRAGSIRKAARLTGMSSSTINRKLSFFRQ